MKDETKSGIFLGVSVSIILVVVSVLIAIISFTRTPQPEPKEVPKTPQELMLEAQELSTQQIVEAIRSGNREKLKEAAIQKGVLLEAQKLSIDTQKQIIEAIKSGNREKLEEAAKQKGVMEAFKASGLQNKAKARQALEALKARFGDVEKRQERIERGPLKPKIPKPEDLERFPPKTETIR